MKKNNFSRIVPCPFCGGEAETYRIWHWFVQCTKCGASLGLGYSPTDGADGDFATEDEAISEWNLRRPAYRGRKESGEWVYGADTTPWTEFVRIMIGGDEVSPETVGQYTSVYDEDGGRIYEGDIVIDVIDEGIKAVVVREKDKFILSLEDHSSRDLSDYDYALKVIGNIHDNPDLLGQKD